MNFRLPILLFIISLSCFVACERKEKAVVDLRRIDEKVIEVRHDEIRLGEAENKTTGQRSSQTAPQKMSDNSEVTVMLDGFGNKLEKRYFKGHPRLNSVLIRTAPDGRQEIFVYGQNGERKPVEGELVKRLLTASADEIANAAKIYETRPVMRKQPKPAEGEQIKPPLAIAPPIISPPVIETTETPVEEKIEEAPKKTDSTENPPPAAQKDEIKKEAISLE